MKKVNFKYTIILLWIVVVTACSGHTSKEQQNSEPGRHNEEQDLTGNANTLPDSVHIEGESGITDVSQEEPVKDVRIFREDGILPEYSGGDVWQYMNDNVRFPPGTTLNRSDNSVIVHFMVEKDGSLNSFSLYAGSYPALDAEVLRVAKTMT
ncbi:energy transducer TonB, partial [Dysgonomonas gadei]